MCIYVRVYICVCVYKYIKWSSNPGSYNAIYIYFFNLDHLYQSTGHLKVCGTWDYSFFFFSWDYS